MRSAVEGLGDLIDGYEFHYPQELSADNLDEIRDALDGHDIYCVATGLHLDPLFGKGGLVSPDEATRREAVARHARRDRLRRRARRALHHLAGDRGLQLPVPDALPGVVGVVPRRARPRPPSAPGTSGVTIFLEHKNSEPAMKILMRSIGMTMHVIHKLRVQGLDNVKVNMDWQHLIMNGESLAEYAALLAAEGVLGHQHANDGWGSFDDDNMVGTIRFMETLELAVELRRAGYGDGGERLGFDLYPYTEDAVARRQAERAPVAVHRRRSQPGSTTRRCARRSRGRTRSRPTRSCTRRSAPTGVSEVAELARALVAIDSVNPDLIPGARGEAEVAGFVAEWLERAGPRRQRRGGGAEPSERRRRRARQRRRRARCC